MRRSRPWSITKEKNEIDLIVFLDEVGWGVVPPNRLGRMYRDLLWRANQRVAAASNEALLVVAGIPVKLNTCGRGHPG